MLLPLGVEALRVHAADDVRCVASPSAPACLCLLTALAATAAAAAAGGL